MKLLAKLTIVNLKVFGKALQASPGSGAGVAFKLNKRLSLAIEDKITIPKTDLLDGQQWQEKCNFNKWHLHCSCANTRHGSIQLPVSWFEHHYRWSQVCFEPLWWLNLLDYAFITRSTNPVTQHLKTCSDDSRW